MVNYEHPVIEICVSFRLHLHCLLQESFLRCFSVHCPPPSPQRVKWNIWSRLHTCVTSQSPFNWKPSSAKANVLPRHVKEKSWIQICSKIQGVLLFFWPQLHPYTTFCGDERISFPEIHANRKKNKTFLDLCLDPNALHNFMDFSVKIVATLPQNVHEISVVVFA